ncbi:MULTISPECIES: alpha-L-arabinofuranosidase C-terminal domain-containing protein [unclassified Microbulbifer]|uniref:alpha-N-arabinofuranosidase n=1 Tax=unclassified Microbulbifer TaxID=2619833 RepID=UPI0027E53E3D|nr:MULTISPECIES: alpha-L-arabinofuranosidase C-terminal domain-containing protein [unclassified Microbulbifer]
MKASIRRWLALAACSLSLPLSAAEISRIEIDSTQPGPRIHRDIYGQFAEHLGRGIYEGIWVGEDSEIENIRGFRTDVIEALRDIKVPLVRWPGGCFADEYRWRDGIGPRDQRPVRVNTHWGGVPEDNAFGTHEFFELVELLGAEAYVNGNLGTGTPREMAEWLEYMTGDSNSAVVEERRKNGRDKPWKVAYFGVGNEAWGCGGNMRPEYYADLYNHYATFLKSPHGTRPKLVASGGTDVRTDWTEVLSANIRDASGISHHFYTLPTGNWNDKGESTGFGEDMWISTLWQTLRMDEFIRKNKKVLDKNDPEKKLDFYVDEWGTWYNPEKGREPGFLYQQNTLRDALVAALNFNIFHDHADRVTMTNIAQMVNVLQAMILTEGEQMVLTPTYHTFGMYKVFQDATALPLEIENPLSYSHGDVTVPAISASAARGKDGRLYLSLVNLNPDSAQQVAVRVKGEEVKEAEGQLLTANQMDAHNTFAKPQAIKPAGYRAKANTGSLTLEVPAKSVLVVALN